MADTLSESIVFCRDLTRTVFSPNKGPFPWREEIQPRTWGLNGILGDIVGYIIYFTNNVWLEWGFFGNRGIYQPFLGIFQGIYFTNTVIFGHVLKSGGPNGENDTLFSSIFRQNHILDKWHFAVPHALQAQKNTTTCRRIRIDEHKWPRSTGALLSWGASSHRCKQNQNCRGNHSFHRSMQIQHKQQKQWRWGNYTSHRYGNNSYAQ